MLVNGGSFNCPTVVTNILQNIYIYFFVFNRKKKLILVWNILKVRKLLQHFHFGVNIPFKGISESKF